MPGCCTGAQTNCPLFFSYCKPYFLLDSETPLMKHRSIQWHCLSCEILEKQCQWVNFRWQTALIPLTHTNAKYWNTGTYQCQTVFSLQHTHVEHKWRSFDHLSFLKHTANMYSSLNTHLLNYPSPRAQPFTGSWWNTEEKRIRDSPEAWIESISLCVSSYRGGETFILSPKACNTQELLKSKSKQVCTPYFYQDEQ